MPRIEQSVYTIVVNHTGKHGPAQIGDMIATRAWSMDSVESADVKWQGNMAPGVLLSVEEAHAAPFTNATLHNDGKRTLVHRDVSDPHNVREFSIELGKRNPPATEHTRRTPERPARSLLRPSTWFAKE